MFNAPNGKLLSPGRVWKTNRCTVSLFDSAEELAEATAGQWLQFIRRENRFLTIALSGGRIARKLFMQIALQGRLARMDFSRQLRFLWADERCVPLDHEASNFRLADEYLFQPLGINDWQRFFFMGGLSSEFAVEQGLNMLQVLFDLKPGAIPVFDLIFLGMGEDGHIASLFPENMEADRQRTQACFHVIASKPPPHRITLGYNVLAAAKEVWVIISGEGKTEALLQALQTSQTVGTESEWNRLATPLQHLFSLRHSTRIFTDIPLPEENIKLSPIS